MSKSSTAAKTAKTRSPEREAKKAFIITLLCTAAVIALLLATLLGFRYTLQDDNTWALAGYSGGADALEAPDRYLGIPVTRVSGYAFFRSDDILDFRSGENMRVIENYAFFGCNRLERVTLNQGVETLGDFCFGECSRLTEIYIPDSVTVISESAFNGCDRLVVVTPAGSAAAQYAAAHSIAVREPEPAEAAGTGA